MPVAIPSPSVTQPEVDTVIVGGGIVGLATARAVQLAGHPDVLVVDKEAGPGAHQTGHNSGVIHSGLYYKPGSHKARLCVEGARAMREFCAEHGIAHRVSGKVVVAVDESELARLDELERRGNANGVAGMRRLDPDGIRAIEPHAVGVAGLHVPTTGVTDYVEVSRALAAEVVERGGVVEWGREVAAVDDADGRGTVTLHDGDRVGANRVVVCAGVQSDRLAPERRNVRIVPFRGGYFDLTAEGAALVNSMIYPVPDPRFPFLGVHFTRHVDDTVSAGPNAILHLAREQHRRYGLAGRDLLDIVAFPGTWRMAAKYWRPGAHEVLLDLSRKRYLRELRRYVPEVEAGHLTLGSVGIRAQAVDRSGALLDDFSIVRNGPITNVLNAPSPAATASLAIGAHLASVSLAAA